MCFGSKLQKRIIRNLNRGKCIPSDVDESNLFVYNIPSLSSSIYISIFNMRQPIIILSSL